MSLENFGINFGSDGQRLMNHPGLYSLPLITAGFIITGLAMFVALVWQTVFQRMLDRYERIHGIGSSASKAAAMASIVTLLSSLVAFAVAQFVKMYSHKAAHANLNTIRSLSIKTSPVSHSSI